MTEPNKIPRAVLDTLEILLRRERDSACGRPDPTPCAVLIDDIDEASNWLAELDVEEPAPVRDDPACTPEQNALRRAWGIR